MTTPTIFSDVAGNAFQAKSEPQGVIAQQANVSVLTGTVIGTVIGMIRVQKGWSLTGLAFTSANLGTSTLDVGFVLDGTTGEDADAYFDGIADSTDFVWPASASSLLVGKETVLDDDGYLAVTIQTANTTVTGDIDLIAEFTYDLKDSA